MQKARAGILMLRLLLLWACCPCAFALDASLDISQYAHTSWKIRDGFTKGLITSIAQTPDGYLWLGTDSGLYRFDGVRAIPWQPPAGQQLPGTLIISLLSSRDGTLWIATNKGLARWNKGSFIQVPQLTGSQVNSLLEARDGTVWVGTYARSGGTLCDIRSGAVHCEPTGQEPGSGVLTLYEDTKGRLWVGLSNGLWRWQPGAREFFSVPNDPFGVTSFAENEQGQLLFGGYNGIRRIVNGRAERYPSSGSAYRWQVVRMFRDHDGALWVGTSEHGLVHIHPNGRTDAYSQPDSLSGDYITRFFEDREGSIWVATVDGIDRFRAYSIPTLSTKQGLSSTPALSVLAATDGSLWISTLRGLDHWNNGPISLFGSHGGTRKSNAIPNRERPVGPLFEDSSGRIWVPTFNGLWSLQEQTQIPILGVQAVGYSHAIAELPADHLWLATERAGLFHLFHGRVLQQIAWESLGRKDFARVMVADPSQRGLWLGFSEGGIAYFAGGAIQTSYSTDSTAAEAHVNDLRFGARGALWAATDGGLSRIKDGHLSTITSKNGLPCDKAVATMEDDDHSMWIYMGCGLVRITQSELDGWVSDPNRMIRAELFDTFDGVRSSALTNGYPPRMTKSRDGKIWFLPNDGVSIIDPHHLAFNKLLPPVHIEQVTADDKKYDVANGLRLPARVRNLDIDYTALSLVVPEKVRFRVKLEGQDKDWRELVNVRHVEYTNLPPKHYRFRVLACNNSGVWNEEGASLDFIIPPAWYQTNWFRAACVVAFMAMIWGVYQLRVRQLAAQFNMRLEERVHERTRIARDLHDTLLQSFHGLLMNLQTASRLLPGRPLEAKERLDGTIEQAEEAIVESRDAVQGLRASTVQRNDLALAISALREELAADLTNSSVPGFRLAVEGTPRDLHPILRDEVYRIAAEALRNAFRHAQARQIEVEIRYDKQQFWLRVRDDGRGFDSKVPAGQERDGHYGLPGMRERAKIAGGKLTVWSEVGAGTEVELQIPAGTAYAKLSRLSWFSKKLTGKTEEMK